MEGGGGGNTTQTSLHTADREIAPRATVGIKIQLRQALLPYVAFAAGEFSWRSGVTWKKIG
eukprot:scaffold19517_cov171-Skeletonema_marinoi.AAC.2